VGGAGVAGGKLKEAGTVHWNIPNRGATNSSGFTGLPGGFSRSYDRISGNMGLNGYWWSCTESNEGYAYHRFLYCDATRFDEDGFWDKGYGLSVRLIKD